MNDRETAYRKYLHMRACNAEDEIERLRATSQCSCKGTDDYCPCQNVPALSHPEPVAQETGRLVAWLIERNDRHTTGYLPHWYAEREDDGWHWWTPDANEAKQFASKAEAGAFPAYQMIASDPAISITEHVFLDASPAPVEPVAQELEERLAEAQYAAVIRWAHDTLYEILPLHYDHDEVVKLNDASVAVILELAQHLGEKHGKTDEWWRAYKATHPSPV